MSLAESLPSSELSSSRETPVAKTIPSSSSSYSSAASHMDHHNESTSLSASSSTNTTTTEHLPTTTTPTATYASSPSRGPSASTSLKSKPSSIVSPRPTSSYYSSSGTRTTSSGASSPPPSSSTVSSASLSAATTSLLMLSSSERYPERDDQAIKIEEVTHSTPQHHHHPQHLQYNNYPQPPRRGDDDYNGNHDESQRRDHHTYAHSHASFPHRKQESLSSDVHNGYEDAEMKDGSAEPTSATAAVTTTTATTAGTAGTTTTSSAPRTKPSSSGTPKATQAKKRLASPSSPSLSTNIDGCTSSSSSLPGGMSMTPSPGLRPQSAEIGSPRSRKNSVSSARKEQKVGVTATSCANCGTTTTPLWRRASNGQTICNACGLYFKARNLTRPPWLKRTPGGKKVDGTGDEGDDMDDSTTTTIVPEGSSDSQHNPTTSTSSTTGGTGDANGDNKTNDSECAGSCPGDGNCNGTGGAYSCAGCPSFNQHQANRQSLVCANCRTTTTPLWRRDTGGNTICNACGLYFKLHNVHRPVTMKRAVIKRRKRVNLLASSPPPPEGEEATGTQPPPKPPKSRQPKSKKATAAAAATASANASTSDSTMPTASDLEPSEDKGDKGETPAKRRKLQNTQTSPKPVPNIEDFIMPKRAANGQTEWMPKDSNHHHHHHRRRSISPIENIGSTHGEKDHSHAEHSHEEGHVDHVHGHDHGHHTPQNHESSYSQQPSSRTDSHAHMRELPPLPLPQEPRYGHSIFHGQYHSSPSMAMSRYPPMHHPSPPRISHSSSQPYSSSSHSHSQNSPHHSSDSRYSPPTHYSRPISMQGYQAPSHHRHDMEDLPTYSPYSSGWNQRLPGYATVSSSANTRLSSTGVVRSGSPPLYPRPVSPSHPYPHSHYRSSGSAHAPLQPGHGYQRQKLPPPTSSSSSSSSYSSSFHHILNPVNSEDGNDRESAQLPPISMPGSINNNNRIGHHQPLPRASEIIQQENSRHPQHNPHHYDQHQRRPASPSGSPMSGVVSGAISAAAAAASTVAGIPVTNTDMLQKTREDLQREVSHLSLLLGRAAAVLNGLDQALGPNGGPSGNTSSKESDMPPSSQAHQGQHGSQSPTHHSSLSTDMKTNSALASLMALSASGGPDTGFKINSNNNNRDDLSSHAPPPPPLSSFRQALPYPLPRRRDRDE